MVGGRGTIAGSDVGGRGGTKGSVAGAEDEDGEAAEAAENDGPGEVAATVSSLTNEQQAAKKKATGVLVSTFPPETFKRYENWRAANMQRTSIRKVIQDLTKRRVLFTSERDSFCDLFADRCDNS